MSPFRIPPVQINDNMFYGAIGVLTFFSCWLLTILSQNTRRFGMCEIFNFCVDEGKSELYHRNHRAFTSCKSTSFREVTACANGK